MPGKLLFLHANFRPKFSLSLPADFAAYTRRWQLAQPGNMPFVDLMAQAGIPPDVDFEQEVYKVCLRSGTAAYARKPACCRRLIGRHRRKLALVQGLIVECLIVTT